MIGTPGATRALTCRGWPLLALVLVLAGAIVSSCSSHHGPLTTLGDVDQYAVARWSPDPPANQVRQGNGIYAMPQKHLILVHIFVSDPSITSLGAGAVRGAVGVWWIALDDRVPHASAVSAGALVWLPECVRFRASGAGSEFDVSGQYLDGPSPASLSRYPLAFNPDDGSVSVALSPADEIAMPRSAGASSVKPRPSSQGACPSE